MRGIILFYSSNYAVWARRVLLTKGLESKMIPVPRELSSECGFCLEIDESKTEDARKILEEAHVEFDDIKKA